MNPLPPTPDVGNLEVTEIYEYFDGPVLFAARNERDQIFLVTLAEDQRDFRRWLLAPMSKRRYEHVRSGGVDLHDAFAVAEGGYVYSLSELPNGSVDGKWRPVGELVRAELPLSGEALDLDTPTPVRPEETDVAQIAGQTRREVIAVRLVFPNSRRSEAPARTLGKILDTFQSLVNAIGQGIMAEPRRWGRIQTDVVQAMTMDVVTSFAGSFGVELRARNASNILGESQVGDAIERLVRLLEATEAENGDELTEVLLQLRGKSTIKYYDFLKSLVGTIDEIDVAWGSPREGRGRTVKVSQDRVERAIRIIRRVEQEERNVFVVTGQLIGLNVRTKSYELRDTESRKYSGKVVNEAMPTVEHATINRTYIAEIREETKTTVEGAATAKYFLLALTPA